MSHTNLSADQELQALRREFDLGFSRAAQLQKVTMQNFLRIRLADDAFAIRVADIAGLYVDRRIMPIPTQVPTLLGVVGFRSLIAPVYDLAALLGYSRKASPRWIMLFRTVEPIALAFEHFETHFSAGTNNIVDAPQSPASMPDRARTYLFDAVRIDATMLPIIHMQSLLEPLQQPLNLPHGRRSTR